MSSCNQSCNMQEPVEFGITDIKPSKPLYSIAIEQLYYSVTDLI